MQKTITDQMGERVTFTFPPQRIVSLVPSQTELLFALGLADRVVGVTKFCVHPAQLVASKVRVGGTKRFRFDVIASLQPDLILGNKEENYEEGIARLKADYPVWMSDIKTLSQALAMIEVVGEMTDTAVAAHSLITQIEAGFANLQPLPRPFRVAYFIWQNPYMVVGQDTFIQDMLARCGFDNVFVGMDGRYPEVTPDMIQAANLDAIFLSSEPFPFTEKHKTAFAQAFYVPVLLVDGELFSWYGSRLLTAVAYLQKLITYLP
jgi:ABC-type Fe3+-hydroxamate transport system substrate-binding protein